MVKGISRQVIVVHSPDRKLFEQAIFILREDAQAVTDEALLKEAERIVRFPQVKQSWNPFLWITVGALSTGMAWIITAFVM